MYKRVGKKVIFDKKKIKLYSAIGPRATFGLVSIDIVKQNSNLFIVTADVSTSAGLDRFRKNYPENYIDVGIAEQNMIGVAAGLSSEGHNVITTTFSPFQVLRCCEQIKVNLGYMKEKISMVGLASGLVLGTLGFTHCSIEDIGVLRSIPNLSIVSPADSLETAKAIIASINHNESTYIRLTGGTNNPIVYEEDYEFKIGKSIKLRSGKDITIFASGAMVNNALKISDSLEKENIKSTVINMHTIKPIDNNSINEACKNSKLIVTLEEHNIIGGLGSAIAEVKSSIANAPKQLFFGVNDYYEKGGEYNYLKTKYNLNIEFVSRKIIDEFGKI
tara:strand:+ start:1351 stop:2346 length:996 start_codon:yes stop_codon:yes gene_type:complete